MKRLLFLLLIAGSMGLQSCQYNSMVEKQEAVTAQWAQVENAYQRRADLIPNLVSTVKGYAAHEREALIGVVEARSKATAVNVDASKLDASSMQKFQAAQDGLSSALSKLMVVVERYPDLKANQNFLELQSQLEGTENRIAVERRRYNEAARVYNTYIRKWPNNMIRAMFADEFPKVDYFEADKGADEVPKVEF